MLKNLRKMNKKEKQTDIQNNSENLTEEKIENKTQPLDEVEKLLSGYTEKATINEPLNTGDLNKKTRGRPKKEVSQENDSKIIPDSALISGSLMLILIDLLIPNLIAFLNNRFSKKKIKALKLQMTDKQKEELSPVADAAAKQWMLQASPTSVLLVALLGIYGVNFMMLQSE
jgi:hypothetical protein